MSTPTVSHNVGAPPSGPGAPAVARVRIKPAPEDVETRRTNWATTPGFAVSCAFHWLFIIALGLFTAQDFGSPRGTTVMNGSFNESIGQGDGDDPAADVTMGKESGTGAPGGDGTPSEQEIAAALGAAMNDAPPGDPIASLPSASASSAGAGSGLSVLGASGGGGGLGGGGTGLTEGSGPRRNGPGGTGETSIFGVKGNGRSFVYVFDRSGSMGGSGRSPLQAAKEQLIDSIESLAETNMFQIVYYNQQPTAFNPAGQGRLAFATESSKNVARSFIASINADGATDHDRALRTALALGPDAIFFLTDADNPLSGSQLEEIRRRNRGATKINCIEFGLGRQLSTPSFLKKLAEQNGGNYGYVDVTAFQLNQ